MDSDREILTYSLDITERDKELLISFCFGEISVGYIRIPKEHIKLWKIAIQEINNVLMNAKQ